MTGVASPLAECVLVRHGETTGNSAVRLYGATDIPLCEHGREQMRAVAAALEGESFDRVVTSPLQRARESAEIVWPRAPATIEPGFSEIDFGRWEGWTFEEVRERDPATYAAWEREGYRFTYPGGESRAGFHARVREAARRVLARPGRTLAVVHKGIIKVSLAALLDVDAAELGGQPVDLGGIHRLALTREGWKYTARNEVEHLGRHRTPDGAV